MDATSADVTRARELFEQMKLGTYPEARGDEFDLFDRIARRLVAAGARARQHAAWCAAIRTGPFQLGQ